MSLGNHGTPSGHRIDPYLFSLHKPAAYQVEFKWKTSLEVQVQQNSINTTKINFLATINLSCDFCLSCTCPDITVNGYNSEKSGRGWITCSIAIWQLEPQYQYIYFWNSLQNHSQMKRKCKNAWTWNAGSEATIKFNVTALTRLIVVVSLSKHSKSNNWMGKHPNDWKKKPSNSNSWQLSGWNVYSVEAYKDLRWIRFQFKSFTDNFSDWTGKFA